jgi:hypothetical protein
MKERYYVAIVPTTIMTFTCQSVPNFIIRNEATLFTFLFSVSHRCYNRGIEVIHSRSDRVLSGRFYWVHW